MQDVCLVIPCFNEARRLPVREIGEFLPSRPHVSLCLVDDGSTDGTADLLESLRQHHPTQIVVRHLARNAGKAEAVRQGVLHAAADERFGLIGYWDADLSTPLAECDRLVAVFGENPDCRLVMGSRVKRLGSDIDRRAVRHVLGRVFSTFASLILQLPVYDSQCGAKVFRAELAPVLFAAPFITRWLFDVELLARFRDHLGIESALRSAVEVPLGAWREVGGSKLRPGHMAKVPIELLAIKRRYPRR